MGSTGRTSPHARAGGIAGREDKNAFSPKYSRGPHMLSGVGTPSPFAQICMQKGTQVPDPEQRRPATCAHLPGT